jgi:hypothetical protein
VLRIESLEIDDHILDKIESKHGVSLEEVEQACLSEKRHVRRSKEGLYKLLSQTAGWALRPGGSGEPGERYLNGSYGQAND